MQTDSDSNVPTETMLKFKGMSREDMIEVVIRMEAVMEENDVFFNGAREERTQQSALGIAQAYSVHHLVPAMRGARLSPI